MLSMYHYPTGHISADKSGNMLHEKQICLFINVMLNYEDSWAGKKA